MPPTPVDPFAVLRQAFGVLRTHFAVVYPVALAFALVQTMVFVALQNTSVVALAIAVSLVTSTFFQGMVVGLVGEIEAGRPESSVGHLLSAVAPVVAPLLAVSLLSAIGESIGFLLIIVPGLVLMTMWAVVAPVVVLERLPVFEAFGRSRALVRGNGWPVLWTILLGVFLPVLVVALVTGSSDSNVVGSFLQVLLGALASSISVLVTAVLYFRLRERTPAATVDPGGLGATDADPMPERRW